MAAPKFLGTLDELKALVDATGCKGAWSATASGNPQFRSRYGGILNWWPETGSVLFQGNADGKKRLEEALVTVIEGVEPGVSRAAEPESPSYAKAKGRHIFVVHGHDQDARDQLELVLHRLRLKPFILMNTTGEGKTLIEALEGQIGRDFTSDFGIALFTPDDVGYAKKDGPQKAEPRARQNVILETGMLLASLTRERMAIIVKGHVELPSDLQGIIRFGYNEHIREIVPKLCTRLQEAGIVVEQRHVAEAAS
jgi:predicted nucleotide-binding protein